MLEGKRVSEIAALRGPGYKPQTGCTGLSGCTGFILQGLGLVVSEDRTRASKYLSQYRSASHCIVYSHRFKSSSQ